MKRDPRIDPRPDDILRKGIRYCEDYYEVMRQDPRFQFTDISFVCDGIERQLSLNQWREFMKDAEVIRCVDECENQSH